MSHDDYTRDLASGIADLETTRSKPGELAGDLIGFAVLLAFGLWVLSAVMQDCGGMTC